MKPNRLLFAFLGAIVAPAVFIAFCAAAVLAIIVLGGVLRLFGLEEGAAVFLLAFMIAGGIMGWHWSD